MKKGFALSFLTIAFLLSFAATAFQNAQFDTRSRASFNQVYDYPSHPLTPTPTSTAITNSATWRSCVQLCGDRGKQLDTWGTDGRNGLAFGDFCYQKSVGGKTVMKRVEGNPICGGDYAMWTKCVCR